MNNGKIEMPVLASVRNRMFKNSQYADLIPEIPKNFAVSTSEENDETVLTIYGDIGESWWYDSTSANEVDEALKNVTTSNITVRLNSPGGDAFDGIAIYNRLRDHKAHVKVIVDGWACSAASIIAMAADELIMNTGSMMMIHEASTGMWGTKQDMRKRADMLDKLDASLVDIYMTKASITREEVETMVSNETWFTADEAITIGFATSATTVEDNPETAVASAEEFKQSVLARFKKDEQPKPKFMQRFKRNSDE